MKTAVLGSGGWGTALALVLLENGNDVTLWSYFEEESRVLRETGENPMLKGVPLPKELGLTAGLSCVKGCPVVVLATPSFAVRTTARRLAPLLDPGTVVVSVSKGIEKDTSLTLTDAIGEELGPDFPVVALCGPSHAEEVGRGVPTAVVSASRDQKAAELVQDLFMNGRFRVYTSPDIVGVELGAALKNIIALCAGVCDGMGFGDNTKAALMTRGPHRNRPAGRVHGRPAGDLCGAHRRGRSDRHLYLHALPQPPLRHPHRPGRPRAGGPGADRRRGRGVLRHRHRQGSGRENGGGDAHHTGGLLGALRGEGPPPGHYRTDDPGQEARD